MVSFYNWKLLKFELKNDRLVISLNLKEEYYKVRQTVTNYLDANIYHVPNIGGISWYFLLV